MGCYTSVISGDLLIKMAKGKLAGYINEHYFDIDSKRNSYVFGALVSCYIPDSRFSDGIIIRSKRRELVELIKDELESKNTVISDTREKSSYWLQITNKNLRSILEGKGLGNGKKERIFPKYIKKEYLDHFIRGFFDARATIVNNHGLTCIMMSFNENKQFLLELNFMLKKCAGVKRKDDHSRELTYGHADSLKIHNFIYRNLGYIEENGLYLSSQKDKFSILCDIK